MATILSDPPADRKLADPREGHTGNDTCVVSSLADLNREIFAVQLQLRDAYRDSLAVGVKLGLLLNQAKVICPYGQFEKWAKEHFEGSARHAQRLMLLAREYPDPKTLPHLSLREALRLISGRPPKEHQHYRHERLSRETIQRVLRGVANLMKIIDKKVVVPLEVEGVTTKHPAAQSARAAETAIRRLGVFLKEELDAANAEATAATEALP
jgi:hypothetical protein